MSAALPRVAIATVRPRTSLFIHRRAAISPTMTHLDQHTHRAHQQRVGRPTPPPLTLSAAHPTRALLVLPHPPTRVPSHDVRLHDLIAVRLALTSYHENIATSRWSSASSSSMHTLTASSTTQRPRPVSPLHHALAPTTGHERYNTIEFVGIDDVVLRHSTAHRTHLLANVYLAQSAAPQRIFLDSHVLQVHQRSSRRLCRPSTFLVEHSRLRHAATCVPPIQPDHSVRERHPQHVLLIPSVTGVNAVLGCWLLTETTSPVMYEE